MVTDTVDNGITHNLARAYYQLNGIRRVCKSSRENNTIDVYQHYASRYSIVASWYLFNHFEKTDFPSTGDEAKCFSATLREYLDKGKHSFIDAILETGLTYTDTNSLIEAVSKIEDLRDHYLNKVAGHETIDFSPVSRYLEVLHCTLDIELFRVYKLT